MAAGPSRAHPRSGLLSFKGAVLRLAPGPGGDESAQHGAQHIKDGRTCITRPAHSGAKGAPSPALQDSPASAAVMAVPRGCRAEPRMQMGELGACGGGVHWVSARQPSFPAPWAGVYFSRMRRSRVQTRALNRASGIRQEGEDARPLASPQRGGGWQPMWEASCRLRSLHWFTCLLSYAVSAT